MTLDDIIESRIDPSLEIFSLRLILSFVQNQGRTRHFWGPGFEPQSAHQELAEAPVLAAMTRAVHGLFEAVAGEKGEGISVGLARRYGGSAPWEIVIHQGQGATTLTLFSGFFRTAQSALEWARVAMKTKDLHNAP